jgi:hypothetical protein
MNEQPFNNSLVIVGGVFGMLLAVMLLLEVVQPVGKQAEVTTAPPAAGPVPPVPQVPPVPPQPEPAARGLDLEMKEREIKSEIERLRFDLEGYRRDLDVAEQREREHKERFRRANLELQARLIGEGVRLGNESLRAGKKVRDTEYRIRTKQQELKDLYSSVKQ